MLKSVRKPVHPALMMAGYWVVIYASYLVAPITQNPGVSFAGFLFVFGSICIFVVASLLGSLKTSNVPAQFNVPEKLVQFRSYNATLLNAALLLGVVGGLMSIYGKISELKDISLLGLAALRQERASELLAGVQVSRNSFSAIGFILYPAGFVGTVITLLRYEQLRIFTKGVATSYLLIVFLISIVAGGRSPILVLIMFIGLAIYVRRCWGLPMIPQSTALRNLLIGSIVAFFAYSTIIWSVRADLAEMDVKAFLLHAEEVWGVAPTQTLYWLADTFGQPDLVRSVMSSIFYFTQSLTTLEKVIAMEDMPMLFGAYHIDPVAATLRFFEFGQEFLGGGYAKLLDENIYGFFAGAWGALFIDFGLLGCGISIAIWGWFAGRGYRTARNHFYSDRVILYIFWMYSVLISFVSPPFGFSNSAITFFWFLVYFVLKVQPIRLVLVDSKRTMNGSVPT